MVYLETGNQAKGNGTPSLRSYGSHHGPFAFVASRSSATALEKLRADADQRQRMGAASLTIMSGWSYEQCRQGITAALRQCVRMR